MGENPPGKKERLLLFAALLGSLLLVSVLAELALRAAGIFETYSEANGFGYGSAYDMHGIRWFRKRPPGHHEKVAPDYTEQFFVNEHGFRDKAWPLMKEPAELRIVMLGGPLPRAWAQSASRGAIPASSTAYSQRDSVTARKYW
jgi:hypothetical protein